MTKNSVYEPHRSASGAAAISSDAYRNRREFEVGLEEVVVAQPLMSRPQGDPDTSLNACQGVGVDDGRAIEEVLDWSGINGELRGKAVDAAGAFDPANKNHVPEIEGELSQGFVDGIVDRVIRPVGGDVSGAGAGLPATRHGHGAETIETPAALRERLAGLHPQVISAFAEIDHAINNWSPRPIVADEWAVLCPLTVQILQRLHRQHGWGHGHILNTRLPLSRFLRYCHFHMGLELDSALLRPDLINNYLLTVTRSEKSIENEQTFLSLASQDLHPDYWEFVRPRQRLNNPPYTTTELKEILEWTTAQSTPERQYYTLVAVALAVGAGLRLKEIESVKARDVFVGDEGVFINAGRLRGTGDVFVQVDPRFAGIVKVAAQHRNPHSLIARVGETRVGRYLSVGDKIRQGAPKLTRLRNTWIVARLREGMSEKELRRLAGVQRASKYLHWAVSTDFC